MATIKPFPNGTYQLIVSKAKKINGGKPYYETFPDEVTARAVGSEMDADIDAGRIPARLSGALKTAAPRMRVERAVSPRLLQVINEYTAARRTSESDSQIYTLLVAETNNPRIEEIDMKWMETLLKMYKHPDMHLKPSTIRKRVGALLRAINWHQVQLHGIKAPQITGKMLGKNYSEYADGAKKDESRTRLFAPGEREKVYAVLNGEVTKSPKGRSIDEALMSKDLKMLFTLIANSGMRLREAYTLTAGQMHFDSWIIKVNGTKGHFGAEKPRDCPMHPTVWDATQKYIADAKLKPNDLLFPFWDGTGQDLKKTTEYLSQLIARLFAVADVPNMKEHDLRHVATVQWVEIKDETGNWMYSESDLMQLMGWSSRTMLDRYIKGRKVADLGLRLSRARQQVAASA